MAQKRGRERGRWWRWSVSAGLLLGLIASALAGWLCYREPAAVRLRYGEFIQVLNVRRENPAALGLQKVQVNHSEIKGDVVVSDLVSDGDFHGRRTQLIPFHSAPLGLGNDQRL